MDPLNVKPSPNSELPLPESDAGSRGILSEGSRFRAYVVGPCIGHGGMARVYRAQHEALQRQVALKVMKGVATDVESRLRFVREARIAAAIKHPNVVNIFDVGVHQGIAYLAMELLEGQDLESLLTSQGSLEERRTVDIMVPIVAALVAVHEAGIVHRDLKPGNVFLARGKNGDVEPKLLDFGVSKGSEPDLMKLSWANGPLLGTPAYVSPEAAGGRDVTPLSDQYSLGVVMYECIGGVHPFAAKTMEETLTLITAGKHVPLRERRPDLSARLAAIVERSMSLDPAARFQDLKQVGRELLHLAGQRTRMTWALTFGVEVESAPAIPPVMSIAVRGGSPTSAPPPVPSPAPRRINRMAVAAAMGVALVGFAALALRGRTLTMRIRSTTPIIVETSTPALTTDSPVVAAQDSTDSLPPPSAAEFAFDRPLSRSTKARTEELPSSSRQRTAGRAAPRAEHNEPKRGEARESSHGGATRVEPAATLPSPTGYHPAGVATPEDAPAPAEHEPAMGANGAPIFD